GTGRAGQQFDAHRLVAPDFLQVVVLADGGLHDVHHDVAQVHHDPYAGILAFDRDAGQLERPPAVGDAGSERAGLAVRGGARDHHPVELAGQVRGVEDPDVLRLDVFQGVYDGALQFLYIHVLKYNPARGAGRPIYRYRPWSAM